MAAIRKITVTVCKGPGTNEEPHVLPKIKPGRKELSKTSFCYIFRAKKEPCMSATYQLTIELPQSVKDKLPHGEKTAKQLIAMDLYKKGGVSVAWAARVAGMDRFSFADRLVESGIEIRQQTAEEVMADADKLERLLASS
jgi:predicted HTH domain antitoxin